MIRINGNFVTPESDGTITVNAASGSTMNLTVDYQLFANTIDYVSADTLHLWYRRPSDYKSNYQFFVSYISVVDAVTGVELGFSNAYQMQGISMRMNGKELIFQPSNGATVSTVTGKFHRVAGQRYAFISNNGGNTFSLRLNDCPVSSSIRVILHTSALAFDFPNGGSPEYKLAVSTQDDSQAYYYYGNTAIESAFGNITISDEVSSGRLLTKSTLLKNTKSPTDFLLDYTKLFGLYYIKDIYSKSVLITNRNNFFTGNVVDWSDRIDYLKNVTVTPILFDKKFYLMQLETPETKYASKYYNQYVQQYGQQRMSTGYNFNYETSELYSDNQYQQIIPIINSDRLYRTFYDSNGNEVPSFLLDNATYELYNGDESISIDLYGSRTISNMVEWSSLGKDI